jgi:hypothetical protein
MLMDCDNFTNIDPHIHTTQLIAFQLFQALGSMINRLKIGFLLISPTAQFFTYLLKLRLSRTIQKAIIAKKEPMKHACVSIPKTTIGFKQRLFVRRQPRLKLAAIAIFKGLLCGNIAPHIRTTQLIAFQLFQALGSM